MKKKIKFDNIWRFHNGCLPQTRTPKFKLFNRLSLTHQIFRIGKYEGKIKFDKIWDIEMRVPQLGPAKSTHKTFRIG